MPLSVGTICQTVGNEINTLKKEIDQFPWAKEWPSNIGSMFMAATYKLLQQDNLAQKYSKEVSLSKKYYTITPATLTTTSTTHIWHTSLPNTFPIVCQRLRMKLLLHLSNLSRINGITR